MDNKKLSEKKQELMKPDWTENLHHELQELPLQEAKWIVENMTDSEIFSKVNNRRFQEDYIADYIEYLWTISPIAYWKHIIASLSPNIGALWSDNMSHFRKKCVLLRFLLMSYMLFYLLQYPMMIKIGKIQKLLVVLLRLKLINLVE